MTINIEITDSPDMKALAALHIGCFEKGWDEQAFSDLFAITRTTAFIAQDGKGFGLLRILGDEAEILTLAVPVPYRRQGLGKALVVSMLEWAGKQGVARIFLEVRRSNEAALELYHQSGFGIVSERRNYYRNADGISEDAVVMRYGRG